MSPGISPENTPSDRRTLLILTARPQKVRCPHRPAPRNPPLERPPPARPWAPRERRRLSTHRRQPRTCSDGSPKLPQGIHHLAPRRPRHGRSTTRTRSRRRHRTRARHHLPRHPNRPNPNPAVAPKAGSWLAATAAPSIARSGPDRRSPSLPIKPGLPPDHRGGPRCPGAAAYDSEEVVGRAAVRPRRHKPRSKPQDPTRRRPRCLVGVVHSRATWAPPTRHLPPSPRRCRRLRTGERRRRNRGLPTRQPGGQDRHRHGLRRHHGPLRTGRVRPSQRHKTRFSTAFHASSCDATAADPNTRECRTRVRVGGANATLNPRYRGRWVVLPDAA